MSSPAPPTSALVPESCLRSPLLEGAGFRHAFLTRWGGVSSGIFENLNFGMGSGDSDENVQANLTRVAGELGVQAKHIAFLTQTHGIDHHVAHASTDPTELRKKSGDIVLTKSAEIAAAVRTADCVPVLLACTKTGWVAACHSGWQGCVQNAAGAAVRALLAQGAQHLVAAIGPHISKAAFEVDRDVAQALLGASPDQGIVDEQGAKPHVDLRRMVRAQLRKAGLQDDNIDDVWGCTVLEPERFFSFRRDRNPSGRMLSLIVGGGPA